MTAFPISCCAPTAAPGGPPVEPGLGGIATSAAKCFFLVYPFSFGRFALFWQDIYGRSLAGLAAWAVTTWAEHLCHLCYHLGYAHYASYGLSI